MTQTDIRREVIAVLVKMGVPQKAITDKASFQKDLGLDSLDFAEMVMEFEMRFNLDIPFTEAEDINNVGEAVSYVNQALLKKNKVASLPLKQR